MKRAPNPTTIGAFVSGALVLLVLALILFGNGALWRDRIRMVSYFPGSVQGLSIGAQVQFNGVTVGQVTGIELQLMQGADQVSIPVHYEIWPASVHVQGFDSTDSTRRVLREMVHTRGLQARLEFVSFVTGQYVVNLSLDPQASKDDARGAVQDGHDGEIVIPALPGPRDQITKLMTSLRVDNLVDEATLALNQLNQLLESLQEHDLVGDLDLVLVRASDTLQRLGPLVERMDGTLGEYQGLASDLRTDASTLTQQLSETGQALTRLTTDLGARVDPLADSATTVMDNASRTLQRIDGLTQNVDGMRLRLDHAVAELERTARSWRALGDYLERHPEALLRGKQ